MQSDETEKAFFWQSEQRNLTVRRLKRKDCCDFELACGNSELKVSLNYIDRTGLKNFFKKVEMRRTGFPSSGHRYNRGHARKKLLNNTVH